MNTVIAIRNVNTVRNFNAVTFENTRKGDRRCLSGRLSYTSHTVGLTHVMYFIGKYTAVEVL